MILFFEVFFHSIFEILPISSSFFSGILNFSINIYLLHGISGLYSFLYFLPRIKEFLNFKFILFLLYFLFFNGLFFFIFFSHDQSFNMLFYVTLGLIYILIELGIEKLRKKNAMNLNENQNLFNNPRINDPRINDSRIDSSKIDHPRKFIKFYKGNFLWFILIFSGIQYFLKGFSRNFFGKKYEIFRISLSIIVFVYGLIEFSIEKSRKRNSIYIAFMKLNCNKNLFNNPRIDNPRIDNPRINDPRIDNYRVDNKKGLVNIAPRIFLWVFMVNCGINCLIRSFFGEKYQIFMIFFSIILYLYSYFKNNGRNEENLNFLQAYDLSIIILMASFCSGISRLGSILSYLLISNFSFKRSVVYGFMLSGIVNFSFFLAKLFFSFEEFKLLFFSFLPSGNIISGNSISGSIISGSIISGSIIYFLGIIGVIFVPIFLIMRFSEQYSRIFILFGVVFRIIIFFYLILFH